MRLFAALDLPPPVASSLRSALPTDPSLRWVPAEQWHLTLAFYGEVADRSVDGLADRLGRCAARTDPVELSLAGAGTFPANAARAQVLWVGVTGDVTGLTRLAERAAAAGRRAGIGVTDRRYRPHLTLARARSRTADLRDAVAALRPYAGPGWTATELRLVNSRLGPPTVHEPVGAWPLGG